MFPEKEAKIMITQLLSAVKYLNTHRNKVKFNSLPIRLSTMISNLKTFSFIKMKLKYQTLDYVKS